jgi:RNA polymerase sigma-70 factor (ECF subfamily)
MAKERFNKYCLLDGLQKSWHDIQLSADLYLAWACLHGRPGAIESFQQQFEPVIYKALYRLERSHTGRRDVIQLLYTRLFTFQKGEAPGIAQFSGQGKLANWLRVMALHVAIDQLRKYSKEIVTEDKKLVKMSVPLMDPEVDYLKKTYRKEFKLAFQSAFQSLLAKERNILRYHLLDRLRFEDIGAMYNVDKSTVSRWMAKIREKLFRNTKNTLLGQLQVDKKELEIIIRFIQSRLYVSMQRMLDKKDPLE